MRKLLWVIFVFTCYATACEQAPKADKAKVTDAQTVHAGTGNAYLPDTAVSLVEWVGTKPTGKHHGSLKLAGGAIYVKDSVITGGEFILNMNSLQDIDLVADTAMKNKLENELKGDMFFYVKKYPTATFEITSVMPFHPTVDEEVSFKGATHIIKGNLTLKAITKNISFPARIVIGDNNITAVANFNIDRTQWGISYRADKSLQDKLINSQVNIGFNISAKR
ncbi:YceI-like domain-containing protein [Chitinophaga niastensis]|uniref:YceI-like domain-containing protein n=1 Tax=Chitinophaga niastensis TaxID=536980 RepID=A0A2P8HRN4_CHINA|nr:YceI family protein [Chitinophaga niastensis]PSL48881.1 YceI-like domain-containing protein [Chitinophaga niastensis]